MNGVSHESPDIAIVGSGPSGLALAGILEQMGMSYVVYEKYARDSVPIGGCLDMHPESGQLAFEMAGAYDEFRKNSRGDPEAMIHRVYDHLGNQALQWGGQRDSPEMARFEIKKALLTVLPDKNIRWNTGVTDATRDQSGRIVLHLTDGTVATGFKLVVGADGTWSKIRPLVTTVHPKHTGISLVVANITPESPFHPKIAKMAQQGPMTVMGRETNIWIQVQDDGNYRTDLGGLLPEDFATQLDMKNDEAVKRYFLSEKLFGQHGAVMKELIQSLQGPFRPWPLYHMPPESLNWAPLADVTLIGDAAHTTIPYVGEGANCAMRDSVILARALKDKGIGLQAITAYEEDMKPYAADVIRRSNKSGELFYDFNSPKVFADFMKKHALIGNMEGMA